MIAGFVILLLLALMTVGMVLSIIAPDTDTGRTGVLPNGQRWATGAAVTPELLARAELDTLLRDEHTLGLVALGEHMPEDECITCWRHGHAERMREIVLRNECHFRTGMGDTIRSGVCPHD